MRTPKQSAASRRAGGPGDFSAPSVLPKYWAVGFYVVLSAPLLVCIFAVGFRDAAPLWALAGLPVTERLVEQGAAGTVFHGTLAGVTRSTPLGEAAVAWIGVVEEVRRAGKGTVTSEKCVLGSLDGLELVTPAGRAPIKAPAASVIDPDREGRHDHSGWPRWWLGTRTESSPLPPAIVAQCRLDLANLTVGTWTYIQHRVSSGAEVEIAGCLRGGAIEGCASGPAAGHLAIGGMRAMILDLADSTMIMMTLVVGVLSGFAVIAGVGALRAIRRAARATGGVL